MSTNIWFTSDTHWFHKNIIDYCDRPFDTVEEMNQHLIDQWNKTVKKNHMIYHLGDFAFAGSTKIRDILSQLNGKIHIVLGNHDAQLRKVLRSSPDIIEGYSEGVKYLKHDHRIFTLSHYPFITWLDSEKGVERSIHLHGHQHANGYYDDKAMLDVGVDSAKLILGDYRPFHYDEVLEWCRDNTKNVQQRTKLCSYCLITKPVIEFHVANNNEDGYRNDCKECRQNKKQMTMVQPAKLQCMTCKKIKLNTKEFFSGSNQHNPTKLKRRQCIVCNKKYSQNHYYEKSYGLSLEEVEKRIQQQNSKCAICKKQRKLVLDHDHATGQLRELLCDGCNRGLGFFKEDVDALEAAISYLCRHYPS